MAEPLSTDPPTHEAINTAREQVLDAASEYYHGDGVRTTEEYAAFVQTLLRASLVLADAVGRLS